MLILFYVNFSSYLVIFRPINPERILLNRNTKIMCKNFRISKKKNWICSIVPNLGYRILSMKISRSAHNNFSRDIFTLFVIFCALLFVCSRKGTIWLCRVFFAVKIKLLPRMQPFPRCQNTKINYSPRFVTSSLFSDAVRSDVISNSLLFVLTD